MKNFYLISQNKSHKKEVDGNFIWCPKTKKDGAQCRNYEFVRNIRVGDIIFCRYKNQLTHIGVATTNCFISDNPFNDASWNKEGYQVNIKYIKTNNQKKLVNYYHEIKSLLPSKYSPFTKDGGSVQAYAFAISDELANYFIKNYLELSQNTLDQLTNFQDDETTESISDAQYKEIKKQIKNSRKQLSRTFKVDPEKESEQLIRNKALGDAGELFALQQLKSELGDLDEELKNAMILHAASSKEFGEDLAGFDIVTYTDTHQKIVDRYIEVKTTVHDASESFYISKNELEFAMAHPDNYYIYRVYDFANDPKIKSFLLSTLNKDDFVPIKYKVNLKK
ncbi:MAG: DUF3883 domain-containing protein [Anaerorhabdus sp.]|uniref:DUF3883 domain-containing protein n=1 Tax=Anaerorhabdus sp. TaxID=1872524 RepID=UPI002FC60003